MLFYMHTILSVFIWQGRLVIVIMIMACSAFAPHVIPAPMGATRAPGSPVPSGICVLYILDKLLLICRHGMTGCIRLWRNESAQPQHHNKSNADHLNLCDKFIHAFKLMFNLKGLLIS
jgi:hypothetical protein